MAQGPERASFFPAIEKKHGQPMSYWFDVMADIADRKYPEQMAYLRENHNFSQAHANALIMYSRGSKSSQRFTTVEQYLDQFDEPRRGTAKRILQAAKKAAPRSELVIAWNKPMVKLDGAYLFGVAVLDNYLLIAPFDGDLIATFAHRLTGYTVNKKTVAVPSDWRVDRALITDMVQAAAAKRT